MSTNESETFCPILLDILRSMSNILMFLRTSKAIIATSSSFTARLLKSSPDPVSPNPSTWFSLNLTVTGWKVLFHSTWKTFKTQFDPILKSLERHRTMLSEEKLTAVMEELQAQGLAAQQRLNGVVVESQRSSQCIQDKLDRLGRELQDQAQMDAKKDLIAHKNHLLEQYRIVESKLDAPNCYEDFEIASRKRFQSTSGNWILSYPMVSDWINFNSDDHRKIYLSGIPGAGAITFLTELTA